MHEDQDGHIHVSREEASGGSNEGVVRWVLVIGILLAIGLLSVTWITGALTQEAVEEEGTLAGRVDAATDDDDATDSIVTENVADTVVHEPVTENEADPVEVPAAGE